MSPKDRATTTVRQGFDRRAILAGLATLALPLSGVRAQGQWPDRPVKLLVGYGAGGSIDAFARILADTLTPKLGQPVVVENVPGAAGTLAAQRLVTSAPDGYTLLLGASNELAATGQMNPAQKYDARRDMTPVSMVAAGPFLLVAGPKTDVKSVAELIALAKANPGKFNYGSPGTGSALHFAAELLKQRAGIDLVHIPYRGTGPLTTDLIGGSVEFAMMSLTAAAPLVQSGRLRALAVTSLTPFKTMPDVPPMGAVPQLAGYELLAWAALMAPKGLPAPVLARLQTAVRAGLAEPAVVKRFEEAGVNSATGSEDVAAALQADIAKYGDLVKFANIKSD